MKNDKNLHEKKAKQPGSILNLSVLNEMYPFENSSFLLHSTSWRSRLGIKMLFGDFCLLRMKNLLFFLFLASKKRLPKVIWMLVVCTEWSGPGFMSDEKIRIGSAYVRKCLAFVAFISSGFVSAASMNRH